MNPLLFHTTANVQCNLIDTHKNGRLKHEIFWNTDKDIIAAFKKIQMISLALASIWPLLAAGSNINGVRQISSNKNI